MCDRVCVHSHFIGRMRIPAPHSEVSWHAVIPRQVPEIRDRWSSIVYRMNVPIWNRQNHMFPFTIRHNPCHSSNIFPNWKFSRHIRVQAFSVFPIEAFVLKVSKANRQLQRTLLVRRSWPARLSKLESRSFLLLLFVWWSRTSPSFFSSHLTWATRYWQGVTRRRRQDRREEKVAPKSKPNAASQNPT